MVEEGASTPRPGHRGRGHAGLRSAGSNGGRQGDRGFHRDRDRGDLREEESRLAYLAVRAGLPPFDGSMVVFDTGGGSSQFTFGHRAEFQALQRRRRRRALHGALRPRGAVSTEVLDDALAAISTDLSPRRSRAARAAGRDGRCHHQPHRGEARAVGVRPDRVQGAILERDEIDRQIDLYRSQGVEERRSIVGLQPKRADVISPGRASCSVVMDKLGQTSLTVSDRALRHGLIVERFGG